MQRSCRPMAPLKHADGISEYPRTTPWPTIVHTPQHYSCQPDGVPHLLEVPELPAGRAGDDTHSPRGRPATVLHRKPRYSYRRYCLAADTKPGVRARPCLRRLFCWKIRKVRKPWCCCESHVSRSSIFSLFKSRKKLLTYTAGYRSP